VSDAKIFETTGDSWYIWRLEGEDKMGGVLLVSFFPEYMDAPALQVQLAVTTDDEDPQVVMPPSSSEFLFLIILNSHSGIGLDNSSIYVPSRRSIIAEWGETESEYDDH
jgi:hypothetical protein